MSSIIDGWIKVASKSRSRSVRGPGSKSLDGQNVLELLQEVKVDSGESPEFKNPERKSRLVWLTLASVFSSFSLLGYLMSYVR